MPLDWLAPFYDRYCSKVGLGPKFREETLRHAALRPGERVLDVGCGTGVLTRLAARTVGSEGSVVGIDPYPKMIQIARENALAEGCDIEFKLAAIENLPFEENRFDCVLSSHMIHHLPPDLKLQGLGEVFRVLRPGGRLVVVDIAKPANPFWWVFVWPLLFWSFTQDHLRGRLDSYFRRVGFSRVETLGHWRGLLTFYLAYKS
ncbi:MAG: methyltransferase domain-containing protein [Nitrospirae bacterium]|nr:methyltransferase domain-containing protein [Nitrospirota bacterium]